MTQRTTPPLRSAGCRVLYFAPWREGFATFLQDLDAGDTQAVRSGANQATVVLGDTELVLFNAAAPEEALALLASQYINALIIDLRCEGEHAADFERREREARRVLALLDHTEDVEARYGFHRIELLLSGPDRRTADDTIARFGMLGISHVTRAYTDDASYDRAVFAERVIRDALTMISQRDGGTRALCAAGGGITGIYFELGALKCLDDCLGAEGINSFDVFYGISAGAVVTGFLANGYSVDEIMASIAGEPGGRIAPLDLNVLDWRHLDLPALRLRAGRALGAAWGAVRDTALLRRRPSLHRLLFEYGEAIGAPFSSDRFGGMLEAAFTAPGATDDFRQLPTPLYVGATDQDSRRHVLFGGPGFDHVPIHQAIQGSLSFNPAFNATEIEDRFYEDGAVTRTSNFEHAIRGGAKLVFVVDPFVPHVSKEAGAAVKRGILYNIDQNVRTISFTRFMNARNWILRRHPEVSAYTFLPSNSMRRLMTINPMDHRPYLAIWRGAYLSTLKRIQHLQHRLGGDVTHYGMQLDCRPAQAVAERLEAVEAPRFADFFPDGRVELRTPPLRPAHARGREATGAAA